MFISLWCKVISYSCVNHKAQILSFTIDIRTLIISNWQITTQKEKLKWMTWYEINNVRNRLKSLELFYWLTVGLQTIQLFQLILRIKKKRENISLSIVIKLIKPRLQQLSSDHLFSTEDYYGYLCRELKLFEMCSIFRSNQHICACRIMYFIFKEVN